MLPNIKMLLGIIDDTKDQLLTYYINVISSRIKNYCGLLEIPAELDNIIEQKVVDWYKNGTMEGNGGVKSVTRGDTKIDYSEGSRDILDDIKDQLNKFRRVRF